MNRKHYSSEEEFTLIESRRGDIVICERPRRGSVVRTPQFPLAWFTPYVQDGALMFGAGYGLLTGKEPSNPDYSVAAGVRVAIHETVQVAWDIGAVIGGFTYPEYVFGNALTFDTPTLVSLSGTTPSDYYDVVPAIEFDGLGGNTQTDGERWTILGQMDADGRLAIAEKVRLVTRAPDPAATIYAAYRYPYHMNGASTEVGETSVYSSLMLHYPDAVVDYYYTEQDIDDDTDLYNYTP